MSIAAKYLKIGFRFFFRRDYVVEGGVSSANPSKAFLDLGVCTALTPAFDRNTTELNDTRGGQLTRVARDVTQINETYTGTFADFNKQNLPLIFGSGNVEVNSRSAIDRTVTHENFGSEIQVNEVIFLNTSDDLDAVGAFKVNDNTHLAVYSKNGNAHTSTTVTSVTWVRDTNYEFDSLLGAVKILDYPAGHSVTHGIAVAYNANAVTTSDTTYFIIDPQSAGGIVEGKMRLELGSNSNANRFIRQGKVALNVSSVEFTAEDYSTYQMEFSILNDGSVGSGVGKLFNVE